VEILTSGDFEMNTKPPKILFWDIETAPSIGYVWKKYQADVIEFLSEWYILSWSAKWKDGKHITRCLADYEGYTPGTEDDGDLVRELHTLLEEADICVSHNGAKFDHRRANTRFVEHGLKPPAPYRTVDTCAVARKYFGFNSNRLDDLGRRLGVGRKVKTSGFDLWKQCMRGDSKAWATMKRYNKQDVLLLERVYDKLLPWIGNHPNVSTLQDIENGCRNCGSRHIQKRGYLVTATGKRPRYQCQDCGAWMHGAHIKVTDVR
jgi:hypothetical protein